MQSKLLLIDLTINYDGGKSLSCPPEDYVVLLLLLLRAEYFSLHPAFYAIRRDGFNTVLTVFPFFL